MNSINQVFGRVIPDKLYIKIKYLKRFHKLPNLKNPKTYNEKLQWLKLYDHNPLYTKLVDKYEAKIYVAGKIGDAYIIPSYGVWDSFNQIDFDLLPQQFVLKTTHDCGGIVICHDKSSFDYEAAKKFLNHHLKYNYFYQGREWPYKNVKPRILAESYMVDNESGELRDYKFFAFNGEVKALFIATERQNPNEETKFDFYDTDFNHLPIKNGHDNATVPPKKPKQFDKMIELASKLSEGFPHVRVDFYEANGRIYFGELTFSHWSGLMPFSPEGWDDVFGSWIDLRKAKNS